MVGELDTLKIFQIHEDSNDPPPSLTQHIEDGDGSTCLTDDESYNDTVNTDCPDDNTVNTASSIFTDNDSVVTIPTVDEAAEQLVYGMTKDQKLWLRYHYALKHLLISYMRRLAKAGLIPKKLEKVKPPFCVACLQGKQHKRPWKGRGKSDSFIQQPTDTFPGAGTSTDQLISPYGGMVPQMKGKLTKGKFYAATVFVDHFSDYTYVHLMKDTTAESTLEAKNAYEALLHTYEHKVLAYHADNGRYAKKV